MGQGDPGTVARSGPALLRWLGAVLCLFVLATGMLHPAAAHAGTHISSHGAQAVSADAPGEPCASEGFHGAGGRCCHGIAGCPLYHAPAALGIEPMLGARTVTRAGTDTRPGAEVPPPDHPPKLFVQA